jgi:mono/diheme cytochrome c family protein
MISCRILGKGWTLPIRKCAGLALVGLLFALGGVPLVGQTEGTAHVRQVKQINTVPIRRTDLRSGVQMYKEYCAVCHGTEGKGDGPAVEFLKAPPPNLRTLARRNNGKYPMGYVGMMLQSGTGGHADGAIAMPLWGPLLRSLHENQIFEELRIYNLTVFIESLQEK